MESLLESLTFYGAEKIGLHEGSQVHSLTGTGGGLQGAFEVHGTGPLVGLLAANDSVEAVELCDGDIVLRVLRESSGMRLRVEWSSGEVYEEELAMPDASEADSNRDFAVFLPDEGSRIADPAEAINDPGQSVFVVQESEGPGFFSSGVFGRGLPLLAQLGPSEPLGPAWFRERLGIRANYVAGAMAGGIASPELVVAMGKAGLIGFYGSGGLPIEAVEDGIEAIKGQLGDSVPAGFNLLHNPHEPAVEMATVDLFLKHGCRMVSASAFMGLTPAVVRYRFSGSRVDESGALDVPNRLYAKVSRPEVAQHFLKPAPEKLVAELVGQGLLTVDEGEVAKRFPMADGITCEADSGGHTDHRPLSVILPVIRNLRDKLSGDLGYRAGGIRVAIGAAGGLGCPASIAAAFEMGADYVLTGSVNQCTPESGTSLLAKSMLLEAGLADVASGAAPDMFELGAHVQVLSRGTMYAKKSERLYDLYKRFGSWEEVPEKDRARVEKQMLNRPFDEVWADTESYWSERDPKQVERAQGDGRHKMALVFRWYLGMSSRWARQGEASRKKDFQIWCGPSMGAFNDWVEGTPMQSLQGRGVVAVADALLRGATAIHRARRLADQGIELPVGAGAWRPTS